VSHFLNGRTSPTKIIRGRGKALKSIEVTLKLLDALASEESGISVLDIARKISFSKSTTHRALQILEKEKFAEKDLLTSRYRRGPKMLDLAFNFISNFDIRNLAHPILQEIVNQVNETVYLCIYTQNHLFFIDMVECSHPIRYINPMGRRPYMHAGAAGKAVLAHLPPERIDQIIAKGLPAFTPNTITDPERLKDELKKIRADGYAYSNSEFIKGGVAIAAPITDADSIVIGCVNLIIPLDRFDEAKKEFFINLVKDSTRKISELLAKSHIANPVSAQDSAINW
jgi:DNA-binding IclR family transcriptional regulator